MMYRTTLGMIAMIFVLFACLSASQSAADTAREILDRRKLLDETSQRWEDRYEKMNMLIFDRANSERKREIEFFQRKYSGDEQKIVMFLRAPAEVLGVGFLSFTHRGRTAEQWLYLPELNRVRKIASQTRNERFVASDLTYHDLDVISEMTSWSEDDAASRLRGEEVVDGIPCQIIELAPKRDDVGYRRMVLWLGRDDLIPRQVEFYDGDPPPAKRIRLSDVRLVGTIPLAHRLEVETPSAGTRTKIVIEEARFNQQLSDELFTQHALERGGR